MALRFLDSFDHYLAADINMKWTTSGFTRRDTGLHGYAMAGNFRKGMLFPTNTVIMETYINGVASRIFLLLDDGFGSVVGGMTEQIRCDLTNTGAIEVSRYGSNALVNQIAITAPDLVRNGT